MHDLAGDLDAFMNSLMSRVDPVTAAVMRDSGDRLARSGIAGRAIGVGDVAPAFSLTDQDGAVFSLSEALKRGPVVALFVRGGWCPFCAITLRAYDRVLEALRREGASLVAISPAIPAYVKATAERETLRYSLLSDPALATAAAYGLVWNPEPEMQSVLRRFGHDLPAINGTGDWRLPIPAGYVIGVDGRVRAARVDTRLTERLPPAEALGEVRSLANTV